MIQNIETVRRKREIDEPRAWQASWTRWGGHWRLRGSSRSLCQKSEEIGNDSSPMKVEIRYSAVSSGRAAELLPPQRGVEGTAPIPQKNKCRRVVRMCRVNDANYKGSDQRPGQAISEVRLVDVVNVNDITERGWGFGSSMEIEIEIWGVLWWRRRTKKGKLADEGVFLALSTERETRTAPRGTKTTMRHPQFHY